MATQQYMWKDDPKLQPQKAGTLAPTASPFSATATAQQAQPTQSSPMTGAAPAPSNPFQSNPSGTQAAPKSFADLLNNAKPLRESNVGQAQQSISQMLTPQQGPSMESQIARNQFLKAQQEAGRQAGEQSALSGRLATGQIGGDMQDFRQGALTQRMDLEGQLSAQEGQRNDQRQQAGLSALLNTEGLAQQGSLSAQDMELRRQAMAQEKELAEKGLGLQEKLGMADLNVREKQLAQQGQQFGDELSFKKWATEQGFSQQEADRAWQATENEKQRTSQEGIAYAGLSLEEKQMAQQAEQFGSKLDWDKEALRLGLDDNSANRAWQAAEAEKQRGFAAGESELDRELSRWATESGLQMDQKQLTEQIRQFDSREEFDRWATTAQLDEQTKNRVWQSRESEVQRKWQSGERLEGQEHEVLIEKFRNDAELSRMQVAQTLNLDTLEKQQAHDKSILGLQNTYQSLRDQQGFAHDKAMAQVEAEIQKSLLAQGYTQDQALQGARLEAEKINGERNREMQERLSFAQMAQDNDQFLREFGLQREQVNAQMDITRRQLAMDAQRFGIEKKTMEAALESTELQNALGTAAILQEKYGDSPDMQQKAAELIFGGLRDAGIISPEEYQSGIEAARAGATEDGAPAGPEPGTREAVVAAQDAVDDMIAQLPAKAKPEIVKGALDAAATGNVDRGNVQKAMTSYFGKHPSGRTIIDGAVVDPGSQGAKDFYAFQKMIEQGVPEATVRELLTTAIREDRVNAIVTNFLEKK